MKIAHVIKDVKEGNVLLGFIILVYLLNDVSNSYESNINVHTHKSLIINLILKNIYKLCLTVTV